eukprot:365419-Chlamydomonas_euryale.AAC.2
MLGYKKCPCSPGLAESTFIDPHVQPDQLQPQPTTAGTQALQQPQTKLATAATQALRQPQGKPRNGGKLKLLAASQSCTVR